MKHSEETRVSHALKTPFNMYIVGSTGSGKTYTLLKILEEEMFQEFTYIFSLNFKFW